MRTKIVCTLGPACDSEPVLREMIRAGMDVARINFSHGTHEDHERRIQMTRRLAREEKALVSVMGDLQGPKFRVGLLPPAGSTLKRGDTLWLTSRTDYMETLDAVYVPLPHEALIETMQPGMRVLIDDGAMELRVTAAAEEGRVPCRVVIGGLLTSRKGVAVPGALLSVSSITEKDREDTAFAVQHELDALALSFVRSADDLRRLRSIVHELGGDPLLVAKIEKPEAVVDLPNILRDTDIIMVARGDLGVEAAPEEVPFYQKTIIRACLRAGVPVITATQMLQSMIHAPRPTRAEASDVANAVLDGTDAVMLSAETAAGEYPIQAVQALSRISARAERDCCTDMVAYEPAHTSRDDAPGPDVSTHAITNAASAIAHTVGARAIVCTTTTGYTARMVARHRPATPVIAMTSSRRTYQFTAFMWDVRAVVVPVFTTLDEMFEASRQYALREGYAQPGDRIVVTAGVPLGGGSGKTNLINVLTV